MTTEDDTTKRIVKAFSGAIPQGPHPTPYNEWIRVRLDFVQESIDHMEWLEKGVAEWRSVALQAQALNQRSTALASVAIRHLQAILNESRTFAESMEAERAARDWLVSIGSEPGEKTG